jgi:hypothetical protein
MSPTLVIFIYIKFIFSWLYSQRFLNFDSKNKYLFKHAYITNLSIIGFCIGGIYMFLCMMNNNDD